MKRIIRNIALGGFMAAAISLPAQNTNSGYFLEGYTYRYQMNPAFGNGTGNDSTRTDANFVSMPGLGNLNVGVNGTLNLSSVLYNVDGRTCLFTNPGVSVAEVMGNIHDKNRIGADVRVNVLSAGFKAWGGYNTVSINARASVAASVPGSFFSLVKEGVSNRTYDIKNLSARAIGYGELALNHSRDVRQVPGLRVGAAMKFLVGVAHVDARFNEAHLTLGTDGWTGTSDADIYANLGKLQFEHDTNKEGREYVSGVNMDGEGSVGPNGFGMAFDLGASYKWKDFEFSLAVLDLGWISYADTKCASTNGVRHVNTDAYIFNVDNDATNSFEKEWDRLSDDLGALYQLSDNGNVGSRTYSPAATLNVGVGYALPVYRKLRFGVLSSTRLAGRYSWTEARVSANVAPAKCFSADANVAFGTFGTSFGWLLSFHHTGFNMFVGMDHTLGKVTKQFVPLSSNASVNFGINFPF
ncbi:MAG: hypothetical protein K2L76_03140 [Muribaculaceae bacterium]|nr:hypothetical protein [Muribaculaceae bacterium]